MELVDLIIEAAFDWPRAVGSQYRARVHLHYPFLFLCGRDFPCVRITETLERGTAVKCELETRNLDRSVGTALSGKISRFRFAHFFSSNV